MRSNKRGMLSLMEGIFLLALVAVVLVFGPTFMDAIRGERPATSILGIGPGTTFEIEADGVEEEEASLQIDASATRTINLALVREYKKDTTIAYDTYQYVNGIYDSVDTDTATPSLTLAYGATADFLVINGTTETLTYGALVKDVKAPKTAKKLIEVELCQADTAPTIRVWNQDNNNLNSGTDLESLSAGDDVILDADYQASADKCWGGPNAGGTALVCFDYNTTEYDDVEEYQYKSEATVPNHLLGTVESCWNIPVARDGDIVPYRIHMDVSSVATASVNVSNVTQYFVDKDYYKHTETKEPMGPATNDDANTQLGFADVTNEIAVD